MRRHQKKKALKGYQFTIDGRVHDVETFSREFFRIMVEENEMKILEAYAKHEELMRVGQVILKHEKFDDRKFKSIIVTTVFRII
jgi:hypothetical protein